MDVRARIETGGVIAIVRGARVDAVADVAGALEAGGVTAVEVTMDSARATDQLAAVADAVGDETAVGAGTVLDAETARTALLAGADFVVSPALAVDVIELCNRYGAVSIPGVMTPTEAVRAVEAGADYVKVFPAATLGPAHLASMAAPLSQLSMVPTGGVTLETVADFVDAGAVAVGVGSALVDTDAVAAGDFEAITETARAFRTAVDDARGTQ